MVEGRHPCWVGRMVPFPALGWGGGGTPDLAPKAASEALTRGRTRGRVAGTAVEDSIGDLDPANPHLANAVSQNGRNTAPARSHFAVSMAWQLRGAGEPIHNLPKVPYEVRVYQTDRKGKSPYPRGCNGDPGTTCVSMKRARANLEANNTSTRELDAPMSNGLFD